MKKTIGTLIIVALIAILLGIVISSSKKGNNQADITVDATAENIFYWGTTCPYCHDVIDWMDESKIEEKVPVVRKEIYNNLANSRELTKNAESCGLQKMEIGVPLLFTTDGDCLIGPSEITSYLEQAAQAEAEADVEKNVVVSDSNEEEGNLE